jgi:tetratricopeptide (TPR) repeat protein/tRNA A-37 threonylcarbamoyl transferase component Bud32
MDAAAWQRLEKLFAQATELPAEARAAFCERACGDDPALHAELLSLLAAHEADHSVLDLPVRTTAGAGVAAPVLPPGTRIGAWRLGALIGRGGAGEVYHVQRADGAFVQAAALKRLHRDAAPDIERFHVERQVLASLEHPGIARLLDGGVADDGRLYAVVEYVDGEPLTTHCDRLRLGLDARLALFLQVCAVVAHAHRSLVVHRDLKPGNILVTAEGRVKLLDFGVAKRLDAVPAAGADATTAPFTSDYAAPEQLTGAPITTATDVYALGVILFELLAGQRHWQSDGMPVARIVQLIVHDEPPSMSRRVAAGSPVPARRLEGDLDAIVATCLHKDAAARYPTVDALARDIERHRSHEPVAARGRARWYRFERALRRHRWALGGAALLFVSLAGGLVATAWQARRAEIERDAARRSASREEAVRYHITNLFRSSIAGKASAPVTAKTMLDRSAQRLLKEYRDDPQLAGKVVVTLADLYAALEDVEGQVPLLEGFLAAAGAEADRESVALAQQKLASIELLRGHAPRAAELLPRAEALWATDPARYREQHLESLFVRGQLLRAQGDLDGAIRIYQTAIAERTVFSGAVHRETANLYNSLAITLTAVNRLDEALAAYRTNLDIYRRLGQADDLDALVILGNTGTLALRTGHLREAEQILKSAVEKQRERAGDSAAVASAMGLYGSALTALGRPDEAIAVLQPAVEMAIRFTGATSPLVVQDRLFLADALGAAGQAAKARETALQTLAMARERFGEASVLTLRARLGQARLDLDAGQAAGAYTAFAGLLEPLRKAGRPALIQLGHALMGCGEALLAQGRAGEAVAPLREAVALREQLQWAQSWELALARVRLGEALKRSGSPGANDLLTQGAAALAAELGDGHAQVQRARRVLAAPG